MYFTNMADKFIHDAYKIVYSKVEFEPLERELNYVKLRIELLKDDNDTMWVKWGNHDCRFVDLPIHAMATIVDNI